MITYQDNLKNISEQMLDGFCVGWAKPLSGDRLFTVLKNSYRIVLALDKDRVVGFVNAISDQVKFAFIPMLEVKPDYKNQGIGTKLTKRLFESLADIDNIDLICDKDLQSYYKKFGMIPYTGMVVRK